MKFSFKKWAFVPALTLAAAFVGCNSEEPEEAPPAPEPGVEAPAETGVDTTAPVDADMPAPEATTPAADLPAPDAAAPDAAAPAPDAAAPALEGPGDVKVEDSPKPATDTPAEAPKEEEKTEEEPKA